MMLTWDAGEGDKVEVCRRSWRQSHGMMPRGSLHPVGSWGQGRSLLQTSQCSADNLTNLV